MSHLIQKVSECNHSNNLNKDCDNFLSDALRADITVADGEHGCTGEVNGVDILN